jgi:aminoglycoside phosphotransferase (APT) family kinase protein
VPPPEPLCIAALECLARLHAAWWAHPRLGQDIGDALTEAALLELVMRVEQTVERFVAFLGDRLPLARRRVYDRLLSCQLALRRRQVARPPTLIHGDAHWWNYLYPREAGGRVLLFDWQLWAVAPVAGDLAHAVALSWFPERRRRLERRLLRGYHDSLCRLGVRGYAWDACWHDYRLFVAKLAFTPAIQWERHIPAVVWWSNLERAMLAFEDLDCEELLPS